MNKIPEVSRLSFLKSARAILKNPLPFHKKNFNLKGNTFRLKLGISKNVVFSRDAMFAQHVLQKNQKNYKKSAIQTKDLAKYVGNGLLTSNGAHWAKQRKLIQPAFHKKQLETLVNKIQEAILTEIEKIEVDQPFNIFPVFNDLAFQTVVKALFSGEVDKRAINRLQYITEAAQEMLVKELRQPYLNWWFKLSGELEKNLALTREARNILNDFVAKRRQSRKRYDDLLDMLLDARYDNGLAMDDEQLIDEILILFTAGHETTSNALTFAAELLARNPSIQDKIYSEVITLKDEDDLLLKLKGLQYTEQVINETMRLYPPAYFIDRVSIESDAFSDFEIKPNTNLLFSIYEIHRDENYFKDSEVFKPDRFEDKTIKYSPYYYPFGAGPRMCIGNNFAMYEMILTIYELMKVYKIEYKSSPIEIKPLITLKPKNAILQFSKRKD